MAVQDSQGSMGRFCLSSTPKIQDMLCLVSQHPKAKQELRELCQQYVGQGTVPWKLVRLVCYEVRQLCTDNDNLAQQPAPVICQGAQLVLPQPPQRQRSQQLQERLLQLQDQIDKQQYEAMVADVTKTEQKAAAARSDPFFPTTRMQLSFGLHVLVTMGAFCALGYYAGKILLKHDGWAALLGALGLTAGLLLETVLLIVRTNMPAPLDHKYAHLLDKRWDHPAAQTLWQHGGSSGGGTWLSGVQQAEVVSSVSDGLRQRQRQQQRTGEQRLQHSADSSRRKKQ